MKLLPEKLAIDGGVEVRDDIPRQDGSQNQHNLETTTGICWLKIKLGWSHNMSLKSI